MENETKRLSDSADWFNATPGDQRTLQLAGVDCVFSFIPKGRFLMGSPLDEQDRFVTERRHEVILSEDFWLGSYQVTQKLYQAATGADPSYFKGEDRPVDSVSWDDCNEFIESLNSRGYAPDGWRFRLPTEAQWEYACRAVTRTPFSFGSTLNGDKANCNGKYPYRTSKGIYLERTTDVGSYPPNAWNLYDMHGNVYEWTQDCYGDYPRTGTVTDPCKESGTNRVLRGGAWSIDACDCRAARRYYFASSCRRRDFGVRLALVR